MCCSFVFFPLLLLHLLSVCPRKRCAADGIKSSKCSPHWTLKQWRELTYLPTLNVILFQCCLFFFSSPSRPLPTDTDESIRLFCFIFLNATRMHPKWWFRPYFSFMISVLFQFICSIDSMYRLLSADFLFLVLLFFVYFFFLLDSHIIRENDKSVNTSALQHVLMFYLLTKPRERKKKKKKNEQKSLPINFRAYLPIVIAYRGVFSLHYMCI